jgi:hypothetical protein
MSYEIIGFGNIGKALAKAFAATASKYPSQQRKTRKALHPMRPRSDPRSFPKHWRRPSRRTSSFWPSVSSRTRDVAKSLSTW